MITTMEQMQCKRNAKIRKCSGKTGYRPRIVKQCLHQKERRTIWTEVTGWGHFGRLLLLFRTVAEKTADANRLIKAAIQFQCRIRTGRDTFYRIFCLRIAIIKMGGNLTCQLSAS